MIRIIDFFLTFLFGFFTIVKKSKLSLSIRNQLSNFSIKTKKYRFLGLFLRIGLIYGTGVGCKHENIDQGRSNINNNINISNCFYSRSVIYYGDGGVVHVSGGSYSIFFNCSCSNNGGAIYFFSFRSFYRMIYANKCIATWDGHFSYLIK